MLSRDLCWHLECDLVDEYVEACPVPVLEFLPVIGDIRVSHVEC